MIETLSVSVEVHEGRPVRVRSGKRSIEIVDPNTRANVWTSRDAFAYISDVYNTPVYRAVVGESRCGGELNLNEARVERGGLSARYSLCISLLRYDRAAR